MRFDVRRGIALLAATAAAGKAEIVAVARLKKGADGRQFEFAIVVGGAWRRQGVRERLLRRLLAVAKLAGIRQITGVTLATNAAM